MKLFIVILVLLITNLYSQNSPDQLIDRFFEIYTSKGSTEALSDLYSTNPWMERNKDALEKIKNQMEDLVGLVGDYYSHEFILRKEIGQSFVLISYLVKYDRQPIRFNFEFYKPKDKWRIYGFSYDDNIDDEIEEAAKLYYYLNIRP